MTRGIVLLLALVFFVGCGPRYGDFYPCYDDGTVKPRIVLIPFCKSNKYTAHESLLMKDIFYKFMDKGNLYIYSEDSVQNQIAKTGISDFFSQNLSYARKFGGADYVISTDLIECRSDFYGNVEDKCMPLHLQRKDQLMLKLRVRVVDIRCEEPMIVLQEILTSNYLIPHRRKNVDDVDESAFCVAAARLADDFVNRIEELTWSLR